MTDTLTTAPDMVRLKACTGIMNTLEAMRDASGKTVFDDGHAAVLLAFIPFAELGNAGSPPDHLIFVQPRIRQEIADADIAKIVEALRAVAPPAMPLATPFVVSRTGSPLGASNDISPAIAANGSLLS